MNKSEFVSRLAYSFGQEIILEIKNDEGEIINRTKNVKLTNLYDYIDEKFEDGADLKDFYKYLIESFKPTNVEKFPVVATIKKLFYEFLDKKEFQERKYIPMIQKEMFKEYEDSRRITYEPPEAVKDSTLTERLEDYEKLNDDDMLKKYGMRLTFEVWEFHNEMNRSSKKNPEYFHD